MVARWDLMGPSGSSFYLSGTILEWSYVAVHFKVFEFWCTKYLNVFGHRSIFSQIKWIPKCIPEIDILKCIDLLTGGCNCACNFARFSMQFCWNAMHSAWAVSIANGPKFWFQGVVYVSFHVHYYIIKHVGGWPCTLFPLFSIALSGVWSRGTWPHSPGNSSCLSVVLVAFLSAVSLSLSLSLQFAYIFSDAFSLIFCVAALNFVVLHAAFS